MVKHSRGAVAAKQSGEGGHRSPHESLQLDRVVGGQHPAGGLPRAFREGVQAGAAQRGEDTGDGTGEEGYDVLGGW